MRIGYIFAGNAEISTANLDSAIPVDIAHDYSQLRRAADAKLLRCCYRFCLEALSLVHKDNELDHFRHPPTPAFAEPPECPYRADRTVNADKIVENLVDFEIRRKTAQRREIHMEASPESGIILNAMGMQVVVRLLHPGADPNHLLFIPQENLAQFAGWGSKSSILSRRPILAVRPDLSPRQQDRFWIISEMPQSEGWPPDGEPMQSLDIVLVDYRQLFGIQREPEFLFIRASHSAALHLVREKLPGASTGVAKILRLLAKRLLVEGARIHNCVFSQSYGQALRFFDESAVFPLKDHLSTAQEFGTLGNEAGLKTLASSDALLERLHKEYLMEGSAHLIRRVHRLEEDLSMRDQKLRMLEAANADLSSEKKLVDEQLRTARNDLARHRTERDAVSAELVGMKSKRLIRLLMKFYEP